MNINEIAQRIKKCRIEHGFVTPSSFVTQEERDQLLGKLMLVVSEVAEMAEDVRHDQPVHFGEELADAMIRLMDIGSSLNMNIEQEILRKVEINEGRPFLHGKSCSL